MLICKELGKQSENQSQGANLPLDSGVLNRALMLLNLTLSEQLIKQWIKKVRPQLECENSKRRNFEKTLLEL